MELLLGAFHSDEQYVFWYLVIVKSFYDQIRLLSTLNLQDIIFALNNLLRFMIVICSYIMVCIL